MLSAENRLVVSLRVDVGIRSMRASAIHAIILHHEMSLAAPKVPFTDISCHGHYNSARCAACSGVSNFFPSIQEDPRSGRLPDHVSGKMTSLREKFSGDVLVALEAMSYITISNDRLITAVPKQTAFFPSVQRSSHCTFTFR